MTARLVRHGELIPEPPPGRVCPLCRGAERREGAVGCERCGVILHFGCYWPARLTDAERGAFAAAQAADAHVVTRRVRVKAGARWFEGDVIVGPSAVADFLNRQIVLCSGCRS